MLIRITLLNILQTLNVYKTEQKTQGNAKNSQFLHPCWAPTRFKYKLTNMNSTFSIKNAVFDELLLKQPHPHQTQGSWGP